MTPEEKEKRNRKINKIVLPIFGVILIGAFVYSIFSEEETAKEKPEAIQEKVAEARPSVFPEGAVACLTEEALDQLYTAHNNSDENAVNFLFNNKRCFFAQKDFEMTYIDRGWVTSHIRIYGENQALEVWTAEEKLREHFNEQQKSAQSQ